MTTENMMIGNKTSPETGVDSLGGEGNSSWLGRGCVGGGESRESGGGGDLTLDGIEVAFSAGVVESAWEEYSLGLEAETGGGSDPRVDGESRRLLGPFGCVCSPTSGDNEGLAVEGSSSTSSSEINRIGGNLERPSVGRGFNCIRFVVGNSRTDNNFMSSN